MTCRAIVLFLCYYLYARFAIWQIVISKSTYAKKKFSYTFAFNVSVCVVYFYVCASYNLFTLFGCIYFGEKKKILFDDMVANKSWESCSLYENVYISPYLLIYTLCARKVCRVSTCLLQNQKFGILYKSIYKFIWSNIKCIYIKYIIYKLAYTIYGFSLFL